eukprot:gene11916-biopygen8771
MQFSLGIFKVLHGVGSPSEWQRSETMMALKLRPRKSGGCVSCVSNYIPRLILRPLILGPLILRLILRPLILRLILRPLILRPLILGPLILGPLILRPLILRPLILRPLILRPLILGPLILGPLILGSLIPRPHSSGLCVRGSAGVSFSTGVPRA